MTKLLDTIDELNRGRDFVNAAYMAAHGCAGLNSCERNALARVIGEAQDVLETVNTSLEEIKQEKAGKLDIAADG